MHVRKQFIGQLFTSTQIDDVMAITELLQSLVSGPSVRANYRPDFRDVLDEREQAPAGCVRDSSQTNTTDAFRLFLSSNDNDAFVLRSPSTRAFCIATDICFINFNQSRQPITARSHHGATQLVKPCPGGFISREAKLTLKPHCANPILFRSNQPHGEEPQPQRLASTVKNRPRCRRGLVVTSSTLSQRLSADRPELFCSAPRT